MYYQNESRFNGVYSRDNLPKKIQMRMLSMPQRKSDILLEIKTCKRIKNTSK